MGCDIHCYAEVKKDKKWEKVGAIFKNEYTYPGAEKVVDEPLHGRNYDLFAILANVRNGHGFAGCVTGEGFNIISEPKGLPKDASKEIKKIAKEWGEDGHSHSWLTVKELEGFDWDQVTVHQGVVGPEEYAQYKEEGMPESWSGGCGGANVVSLSNQEMDKLLTGERKKEKDKHYITTIKWEESYRNAAGHFLFKEALPALKRLGDPENVRIVFWFDN